MPTCSVPYCVNASGKDTRLTFHEFPHETPLFLKKWLENIGRPNWRPGLRSVICSEHFVKDDFDRKGRLYIGSFPSKFPEPPFRKKRKTDSEVQPAVNKDSQQSTKSQTHSSKVILLSKKESSGSALKKEIHADLSSGLSRESRDLNCQRESHSQETNTSATSTLLESKSVANENTVEVLLDENQSSAVEVLLEENQSSAPVSMAEVTPKSDKGLEIPMKRKILEERQPVQFKSSPVVSVPSPVNSFMGGLVASSYSLMSCRVCGVTNNLNVKIFGPQGKQLGLAEMIEKCLPIKVSESDSLPHCLCKICISRLKTCSELILTCESSNNTFRGKSSQLVGTKDADPPIIHSRPVQSYAVSAGQAGEANRRVLLLEMSLKDGIPVKGMIAQAIQELSLRLKPKEKRETKPEGRIMFLDLQGGPQAFPEQMKKAIAMLFPYTPPLKKQTSPPSESTKVTQKVVPTSLGQPQAAIPLQTKVTVPTSVLSKVVSSTSVQSKMTDSTPIQSKIAVSSTLQPQIVVSNMGIAAVSTPATLPPSATNPLTSLVTSLNVNQNLIAQNPPLLSGVPLTILPNSSAPAGGYRLALPGPLPSSSLTRLIHLPSNNLIKIQHQPAGNASLVQQPKPAGNTSLVQQLMPVGNAALVQQPKPAGNASLGQTMSSPSIFTVQNNSDDDDDGNFYDDSPPASSEDVPPLVAINTKASAGYSPKKVMMSDAPAINIAKLKDKVITKINNIGNTIKLGDKIVGIVLRNSDSREDIHKKLQATFSNATPLKTVETPVKSKKRAILPKGTVAILPKGTEAIPPKGTVAIPPKGTVAIPTAEVTNMDSSDGTKKTRQLMLDVPSTVDDLSAYFDRRNARKLSLSFMWRKTGFLVSSYQKLFTWQMGADDNAYPVLTCRVCKFAATSKNEVETHLHAHPDLQCSQCTKYFLTVSKVHEHMSVIHNIFVTSAADAGKKKTYFLWRQNSLKKGPLKPFQCSRCDKRFRLKDGLKRHAAFCKERSVAEREVAMKKANLLVCSTCNRTFNTPDELKDHELTHAKRTEWLCDICGTVLKSASNYRSHIARHDELAHEYNYQCHICKKRFKLDHRFQDHMKKHDITRQYICASCGKTFRTPSGLRQHEILHGERKLQCRYCPSRFHRRDHLRMHENSHTKTNPKRKSYYKCKGDQTGRMFTCRFCVASQNTVVRFPSMRELLRHYSDSHPNDRISNIPGTKRFQCDRCYRTFASSTLLRHHHMWHAGLFPYTCSFCGAGFMVKERMHNHEHTHTNERPHKCQTCGKGFRSRNCLKQHKVLHKDPSEFHKCKYCDKTFSRIDNLRTHTRVHTGEKPWKCLQCNRQFRLRSECTKHIQIAHQVSPNEIFKYVQTLSDPNNPERNDGNEESQSPQSAIQAAIAGIAVQDMELLIEDADLEEVGEDSL